MSEQNYEWPQAPRLDQKANSVDLAWHQAINRHSDELRGEKKPFPHWMYDAKKAAQELPRLALLFSLERTGNLDKTYRKCGCCSEGKHVEDNHLTCCLGTECRECPHLAGLDKAQLTPEEIDWAKAWTCVGHILAKGGDPAGEGFLVTVDDRMYWDSVHQSLAYGMGGGEMEEPI